MTQQNVLLVTFDLLRSDTVYDVRATTRTLEELANESTIHRDAFSQGHLAVNSSVDE